MKERLADENRSGTGNDVTLRRWIQFIDTIQPLGDSTFSHQPILYLSAHVNTAVISLFRPPPPAGPAGLLLPNHQHIRQASPTRCFAEKRILKIHTALLVRVPSWS